MRTITRNDDGDSIITKRAITPNDGDSIKTKRMITRDDGNDI
jgi:hypothetical protein